MGGGGGPGPPLTPHSSISAHVLYPLTDCSLLNKYYYVICIPMNCITQGQYVELN